MGSIMIRIVLLVTIMAATSVLAIRGRPRPWANSGARRALPKRREDFTKLCPCALAALSQMDRILRKHHAQSVTQPISSVMKEIQNVAHACTTRDDCRCPEGYTKSDDGFSCYSISEEDVTCNDAKTICEEEFGGKLAVAKSREALLDLAKFIKKNKPDSEEFYWIGLSYNTTIGGTPIWKWSDGSKADYAVTKGLKNSPPSVKKSLINFSGGENLPIERVAISSKLEGARWRQETCGSNYLNEDQAHHPYICEYTMFKVQILSEL